MIASSIQTNIAFFLSTSDTFWPHLKHEETYLYCYENDGLRCYFITAEAF